MITIEQDLNQLVNIVQGLFDRRYQQRGAIGFYRGLIEWSARTPTILGYVTRYGLNTSVRSAIGRQGLPGGKGFSDAVRVSLFHGLRGAGHSLNHISYAMGWSTPQAMCRRFKAMGLPTPSRVTGGLLETWNRYLLESFDPVAEQAMRLNLTGLWRAA